MEPTWSPKCIQNAQKEPKGSQRGVEVAKGRPKGTPKGKQKEEASKDWKRNPRIFGNMEQKLAPGGMREADPGTYEHTEQHLYAL